MSTWHLAHPCPCDLESLRSLRCLENEDGSSQRYQADSTWWTGDAGKRQVHHCAAHNAHNANMYSYLLLWDQTSTWQEQDLPQRQRGWILDLTLQIFWSFRMLALCFKCPQRLFLFVFYGKTLNPWYNRSNHTMLWHLALHLGEVPFSPELAIVMGDCFIEGVAFGLICHPSTQRFWRQKVKEKSEVT